MTTAPTTSISPACTSRRCGSCTRPVPSTIAPSRAVRATARAWRCSVPRRRAQWRAILRAGWLHRRPGRRRSARARRLLVAARPPHRPRPRKSRRTSRLRRCARCRGAALGRVGARALRRAFVLLHRVAAVAGDRGASVRAFHARRGIPADRLRDRPPPPRPAGRLLRAPGIVRHKTDRRSGGRRARFQALFPGLPGAVDSHDVRVTPPVEVVPRF